MENHKNTTGRDLNKIWAFDKIKKLILESEKNNFIIDEFYYDYGREQILEQIAEIVKESEAQKIVDGGVCEYEQRD